MLRRKHIRFLRLYEPVHDRFERFCRVRCYGEMAPEDLMNETLMIAYEKLDQVRSNDVFLSFLCGISLRVLANDHRKMRPENAQQRDMDVASQQTTDAEAEKHFLFQAIAQLPAEQREALILFEITGFRIREIAEIQQTTEDAVKQRLKRGRDRLKEILTFESHFKTGNHDG